MEKCGGGDRKLNLRPLVLTRAAAAAAWTQDTALTRLLQVHLNAALAVLAAVPAQVRRSDPVHADGEVPPRSSVGEGLHSTRPGLHEADVALGRDVDQEGLMDLQPGGVGGRGRRQVAGEEHRGAAADHQPVGPALAELLAGVPETFCRTVCPTV